MNVNYEKMIDNFITTNKKAANGYDNFEWDNSSWGGGITFYRGIKVAKKNHSKVLMDNNILDFAKAYVFHYCIHDIQVAFRVLRLFRVLEVAMLNIKESVKISSINHKVLDEAMIVAHANFASSTVYKIYLDLKNLCSFMSNNQMLPGWITRWSYPFKISDVYRNKTIDPILNLSHEKKLPDERVIEFIGKIFASNPVSERDIFTSCIFALLLCAPSRISEIMLLEDDCEVVVKDNNGALRYGLRFFSLKGFGYNTKWISESIVPVASQAITRLKKLTNNARVVSKLIILGEGNLYKSLVKGVFDNITIEDLYKLGFDINKLDISHENQKFLSNIKAGTVSVKAFWTYIERKNTSSKKISNKNHTDNFINLFSINLNLLNPIKGADIFTSRKASSSDFRTDFRTDNTKNIFHRNVTFTSNSEDLRFHSHQIRHLLNTIAQRSMLSEIQIAQWSGRRSVKQNAVYDHMSYDELTELSRKVLHKSKVMEKSEKLTSSEFNAESNFKEIIKDKFEKLELIIQNSKPEEQIHILEKIKKLREKLEIILR